jgi:hypothetical protein
VTAPTLGVLVPDLTPTAWAVVVVALLLLAVVTWICVVRARRLDRLHRRTDAARAGLADALDRRGATALRVADAIAAAPRPGGEVSTLPAVAAALADGEVPTLPAVAAAALAGAARDSLDACRAALRVPGAGLDRCEVAENTLTRRLAGVDRDTLPAGLAAELADVEQSVLIARRVHNDAVRDTLDLRSRRLVRSLRLAGTAPAPAYFEIAEAPQWRPSPSGATVSARTGTGTSARAGTGSARPA